MVGYAQKISNSDRLGYTGGYTRPQAATFPPGTPCPLDPGAPEGSGTGELMM